MAPENLSDELPRIEADFRAVMVAFEKPLEAERVRSEGPKCELATEFEKKQQLLTSCCETSQTAGRPLVKGKDSLLGL